MPINPSMGTRPAPINPENRTHDTFAIRDFRVRPSESPTDLIIANRTVDFGGGDTATLNVPFEPGSKVYYVICQEATVTDNGGSNELAIDKANDGQVKLMIFGRGQNLFNS